jgi:hypothetical protein
MKVGLGILITLLNLTSCNTATATTTEVECPKGKWTEACLHHATDARSVKPRYLSRIKFQHNGFAVIFLETGETVAVNRKGTVVVPGIVNGTYDFRDIAGGISMFVIPAKEPTSEFNRRNCGYFQRSNFKIIIPPIYNGCAEFQGHKAAVCTNCRYDCVDCNEVSYYGDGEVFIINTKNEILKRFPLPRLPRCSTVEGVGGYPEHQQCRSG